MELRLSRAFGAEATVDIEACETPEARIAAVRDIVGGYGADLVMECSGHPSAGPEGIEFLRDGVTVPEDPSYPEAATGPVNESARAGSSTFARMLKAQE